MGLPSTVRLGILFVALAACGRQADRPTVPVASPTVPATPTKPVAQPSVPPPEAQSSPTSASRPTEPLRVGGDVLPPVAIKRVQPDYTKLGHIRAGGVPVVEATITAQGDVTSVRVIRSVHPELDAAIVAALRQWKFRPATQQGRPVAVHFVLTVNINWQ